MFASLALLSLRALEAMVLLVEHYMFASLALLSLRALTQLVLGRMEEFQ